MEEFFEKLCNGWYLNNDDAFKTDSLKVLGEYYNIDPDDPKLDKLFYIAWGFGHSSGHFEVWCYMEEMVELIR